jgi:hypothetical protein
LIFEMNMPPAFFTFDLAILNTDPDSGAPLSAEALADRTAWVESLWHKARDLAWVKAQRLLSPGAKGENVQRFPSAEAVTVSVIPGPAHISLHVAPSEALVAVCESVFLRAPRKYTLNFLERNRFFGAKRSAGQGRSQSAGACLGQ